MFQTAITELIGIEYPVFQGGMAWVAESSLAAAVSNGGGLGIIACGAAPPDFVRGEIHKLRAVCDKPFGVNIMLMSPYADELAQLMVDEMVPVVTTGAGSPAKYMPMWKEAGIKVIPVIPTAALARRMERAGADAVIAEGGESGGHIGELATITLVPQVVSAVSIPVIAAGGIADGRGVAAVLMLGAQGVQCGTRFIVADECRAHDNYKNMVLEAGDTATAVTGRSTGHPVRAIKNQLTKKYLDLEKQGATSDELEAMTIGSLRKAFIEGDLKEGTFMAGQSAGMVEKRESCADIIRSLMNEAKEVMDDRMKLWK